MDVYNFEVLGEALRDGFEDWASVGRVRSLVEGDLVLFDYRTEALYGTDWNWFELQSRGLIMRRSTGAVVALPFAKFFNWGEGGRISTERLSSVTEKLDGSMGVGFWDGVRWRVTTRGSFGSPQGLWATQFLKEHHDLRQLPTGLTLLFEIIFPENRVVVSYGDRQALFLIGVRDRESLADWPWMDVQRLAEQIGFPTPRLGAFGSVNEVLADLSDAGVDREGWVMRFEDGVRFKVKGAAYVYLHKALSGVSFVWVLDGMRSGRIEELLAGIPDEFLGEARGWRMDIESRVEKIEQAVEAAWAVRPVDVERAVFARWVMATHADLAVYLFARLDGRSVRPLVLRREF